MRGMLILMGFPQNATIIEEDNQACVYASEIPQLTKGMKHVRQSNIQLTCYSYRRNCDKPRLRCSLLNCDYTLQVLQQVATNDYKRNGRCITQISKHECASVHIVKQQTATFQTYGLGSVHLYATHDILTCNVHTNVYNLDLRILNIYTCVGKLISH